MTTRCSLKSWLLPVLLILMAALIAACDARNPNGGEPEIPEAPEVPAEPGVPGEQNPDAPTVLLSFAEDYQWPAGGHELILRAEGGDGKPWGGAPDGLSITAVQSTATLPSEIRSTTLAPGVTLIAVQPDPAIAPSIYQDAIRSFIEARPPDERIAVYGWGNDLVQICDFTRQRERLFSLSSRLERIVTGQSNLNPQAVFEQALKVITRVEKPNLRGMRSVVFVSSNPVVGAIPRTRQGIAAKWVLAGFQAADAAPANVISLSDASGLAPALLQASEQLNRDAAEAYYKIVLCADPVEKTLAQVTAGSEGAVEVELDKSVKGEANGRCDVAQIAAGNRKAVDTIQFFFNDEELAVYRQRCDEADALLAKYEDLPREDALNRVIVDGAFNGLGDIKENFSLTISLDPAYEPAKATAHLRGQHALFYDRRSYTVNLSGKDARYFGEGSGNDEFYLIAMNEDPNLLYNYFGDTLYSQFDLFPLRIRFVELLLNGETQGVYLLMEKRKEEILRDSGRLRGIVRRGYEGARTPEIDYTINDDATMLAAYRETLAMNVGRPGLPDYLREHLDLDQYLTWMGLNSIMQNYDSLDETFFISTESIDATGHATDYFRLMAWDPEDIQGECPTGDLFPNDYNLTFCQQSAIERRMIGHPVIFGDYVKNLKQLLNEVTPEKCQAIFDAIEAELFPLLERPGVIEAMQRPTWTDARSVENGIRQAMGEVQQNIQARLEVLQDGIKSYEDANQ